MQYLRRVKHVSKAAGEGAGSHCSTSHCFAFLCLGRLRFPFLESPLFYKSRARTARDSQTAGGNGRRWKGVSVQFAEESTVKCVLCKRSSHLLRNCHFLNKTHCWCRLQVDNLTLSNAKCFRVVLEPGDVPWAKRFASDPGVQGRVRVRALFKTSFLTMFSPKQTISRFFT